MTFFGELMRSPQEQGRFGEFGGRFVPEALVPACEELEAGFESAWADPAFRGRLDDLLEHYGGRPTPVTECRRLGERLGIRLLLKREDLAHTGSHKLNNVIGQALLAERMGKRRLIAETGAGQHGVAAATAAALLGLGGASRLDERPHTPSVLLADARLHTGGDVDAPGVDPANRVGHVVRIEASGKDQSSSLRRALRKAPVEDLARSR